MVLAIEAGPLLPAYEQAKQNGSLAIGSFDQFVEAGGVPLVGTSDLVMVLVDEDTGDSLRVAGKRVVFSPHNVQFEGGEHTAIGDSVILRFSAGDPGTHAYALPLALQNGLALTYGQIVALGGDFYGVPDAPISDGPTPQDRQTRFQACFDSLAVLPASEAEATEILAIMQREINAVNAALAAGLPASSAYDQLGDDLNKAWNVATGGGSFISDLIPMGRYLKLATVNWDHFAQYAVLAYKAGHAVALAKAIQAHGIADPVQARAALVTAYALNAFADHFLTDLFSSGHIRDPRKEIYETSLVGVSANLCAKGMHDEDCKYGLRVSNAIGDTWRAYGDKRYFDTVNLQNRSLVNAAAQVSADEIFNTFLTGQQPVDPDTYMGLRMAPNLAQVQDYQNNPLGNFVPMFVLTNTGSVQCRNDLNDLNTPGWTSVWTTGLVAARLHSPLYNPNQPTAYIAPPAAAPAISPNGWATGQPIPPNWVAGNNVRYFVSFYSPTFESIVGPGCPYYALTNQFEPTLVNIPLGPAGVMGRIVYREFQNQPIQYCGTIADNVTAVFSDTMP